MVRGSALVWPAQRGVAWPAGSGLRHTVGLADVFLIGDAGLVGWPVGSVPARVRPPWHVHAVHGVGNWDGRADRAAQPVSFHAACRFFSAAVWDADRLGLLAERLIVGRLLPVDATITVVVDDTLFKRWGRKIHHAFWTHDGAAQGGRKIARGNRWVVAGIVVRLPFCTAPVCLPVLFRLWAGKGTTTPVELAAQLLGLVAAEFPEREVHGVGDAAYHGRP